jgi:HlyD family secretion protein
MRRKWVWLAVAAAVAVGGTWWALRTTLQVDVAAEKTSTGTIVRRIFATGTIQPTRTVDVGAQVSGVVQSLAADFNSIVRANQVVARLDPSLYDAALAQARATRAQADAAVVQAKADLAGLRTAEVDARTKLARAQALAASQLIDQADLDAAQIAMNQAVAGVNSGEAQVSDAVAAVAAAAAAVTQAAANLDHTVIHSPIDGIVLSRAVDVGQTVAAAVQAPVLFTIATNLQHLQLEVDVDQADIGGIETGQPVTFEVESYPDEMFTGRITQVRLQPIAGQSAPATTVASSTIAPTTTQMATVISYATMIDVDNPGERLRPGMTASVVLRGARRANVVRIPNRALSFRPSPDVFRALGEAEPVAEAVTTRDADNVRPRDLWTFDGTRLVPVAVRTGLSDDQWTELVSGAVRPGDAVVTAANIRRRARF